jgi:putative transposase
VRVVRLFAGAYLAGTNTRWVRRALATLFGGPAGNKVFGPNWRKMLADRDAWDQPGSTGEKLVRPVMDGPAVRERVDGHVTPILRPPRLCRSGAALGSRKQAEVRVRQDGQILLLTAETMSGESEGAGRGTHDDLVSRSLCCRPASQILGGTAALYGSLAALSPDMPVQHPTVHRKEPGAEEPHTRNCKGETEWSHYSAAASRTRESHYWEADRALRAIDASQ